MASDFEMRFPARLSLALARARLGRRWTGSRVAERFQFFEAAEILHAASANPVARGKLAGILAGRERFLWIGGGEPLEHPGIAHLVRAVAQPGRFVFLETSGVALRRRIHEFAPLPGIIFVVRFESPVLENSGDARNPSRSALALEGMLAAQLSGFWTVAHLRVSDCTELTTLREFRAVLHKTDCDGWLISAADSSAFALRKAGEARALIRNRQWRRFSEVVEWMALRQRTSQALHTTQPSAGNAIEPLAQASLPLAAAAEAPQEGVTS